jgi:beta-phosphoglucomutase-like phosphatase (HAD superfamily)
VYLEACRRLGVVPSLAVALEDSTIGIAAARRAGLMVIAVPESDAVDTSEADGVAASLAELLPEPTAR